MISPRLIRDLPCDIKLVAILNVTACFYFLELFTTVPTDFHNYSIKGITSDATLGLLFF